MAGGPVRLTVQKEMQDASCADPPAVEAEAT